MVVYKCWTTCFIYIVQGVILLLMGLPITFVYLLMHLIVLLERLKLSYSETNEPTVNKFQNGKMFEIDRLTVDEIKDFKKHRSGSYIKQLTFGSLWEFSKYITGQQRIRLIEDHVLYNVLMKVVFCNQLQPGDEKSDIAWQLKFDTESYKLFPGLYWDIHKVQIHKNKTISLVDRTGKLHTSSSPTWDLAKAHAQVQLTFLAPGQAHNHVHFVFPTVMAQFVRTRLPKSSVLRQLVEPHTRFTQYINHQALKICRSSTNTMSLADQLFRPWLSFPVNNDDFLHGIQKHCENFYYERLQLMPDLNMGLSYHKFLKEYYNVVYRFVKKLKPLIEDDYLVLYSSICDYLPNLAQHSAVDVIAALLWNCAVVHCCDHRGYLRLFAEKYGCMCMRIPLINDAEDITRKVIKENHNEEFCSFFAQKDIYHMRCCMRSFVEYSSGSSFDLSLQTTEYSFTNLTAISASIEFLKELKQLDNELRNKGEDILPLDSIIRTVCF